MQPMYGSSFVSGGRKPPTSSSPSGRAWASDEPLSGGSVTAPGGVNTGGGPQGEKGAEELGEGRAGIPPHLDTESYGERPRPSRAYPPDEWRQGSNINRKYPGGELAILTFCGNDATEDLI